MIRRTFIASLLALPSVLLVKWRGKTISVESVKCEPIFLAWWDEFAESNIVNATNVSNRTIQRGEPVYLTFDNATARWGVVVGNPGVMQNDS